MVIIIIIFIARSSGSIHIRSSISIRNINLRSGCRGICSSIIIIISSSSSSSVSSSNTSSSSSSSSSDKQHYDYNDSLIPVITIPATTTSTTISMTTTCFYARGTRIRTRSSSVLSTIRESLPTYLAPSTPDSFSDGSLAVLSPLLSNTPVFRLHAPVTLMLFPVPLRGEELRLRASWCDVMVGCGAHLFDCLMQAVEAKQDGGRRGSSVVLFEYAFTWFLWGMIDCCHLEGV